MQFFQRSTRLLAVLAAISLPLMLGGCTTSTPSASAPIELGAIPSSLTHCDRPTALPTAAMSQADVERYWARDRVALEKCGANVAALDRYFADLRSKLGAAKAR